MTNENALPGSSRVRQAVINALSDNRLRLWWFLAALFVAVSAVTRIVLGGVAIAGDQAALSDMPALMAVGLVYDVVTALSLFAPFAIYLALVPERLYRRRGHRWLMAAMCSATVFGLIYLGAVEYFFFDEFNARFNFVAVEYLIYPHEVFVNIWHSYPVAQVLAATALLTASVIWLVRDRLFGGGSSGPRPLPLRLARLGMLALLIGAAQAGLNVNTGRYSENRVVNELAVNGVYSFFNAALNSELDYGAFYLSLPGTEADERLRSMIQAQDSVFFAEPDHIKRRITADGPPKHLHVVVLLEESLGAEFVGAYGDKRGLTPELDRLAETGMLFTHAYATGTRTVRGTNGYRVIDRTDLDAPRFANIWGVSDEDLFRNAVRVFDEQHGRGEKIFSIIMTTSNHKPYTFPPGIPSVPEKGGGRDAGVRYADYSIGRLFEMAKSKPWFDDTLFVIVADHGARVYGREDIPVTTYEIPLILYAPRHIKPRQVDTLISQIDVAPTVIGMLDFDYDSAFFGSDVLLAGSRPNRLIPLNHNRDIALFDGRNLFETGFRKTSAQFAYDPVTHQQTRVAVDPERMKDVVAVFQKAFEFYNERRYNIPERN